MTYNKIYNVRDYGAKGDGSTDDIAAITAALTAHNYVLIKGGVFIIGSAILLASNKRLFLENCEIRLKDNCYDNLIRNSDLVNGNTDIKVIGNGVVKLNYNNTVNSSRTDYGVGGANSYKYNGIIFCDVNGFELKGLETEASNGFNTVIQRCSNGVITDYNCYKDGTTPNQDGLHICHGSHDITVTNYIGHTGDDSLTVLNYNEIQYFCVQGFIGGDCYNITFNDCEVIAGSNGFRLLSGDGSTIHDITINNLRVRRCYGGAIKFGDASYCLVQPPTKDSLYNINVNGIQCDSIFTAGTNMFHISQPCRDIVITNAVNNSGKNLIANVGGHDVSNVWVNGTKYF